ncbi:hypothetical protein BDV27DRAFT_158484 [Aspergillus caelatus]|uniref:Zn(2)-C6 fungal-type domain-containing protein n=1 Tax=Aspergillus caelatus TaxID=61420 RepID=A0A5N7A2L7_9EURO|nr:uncharacterized protein BDV27DRAFT_158484 [Aspergillus caelatus]KAE8363783.1 hypothetical protein BDV27DRAFT_158484 [Aspergillus caelatus]
MSRRTSQACDACRYRKVKCNGARPCSQCAHLNLSCNFSVAPVKRRPGGRGHLVAQLRTRQVRTGMVHGAQSLPTISRTDLKDRDTHSIRPAPGAHILPVGFFLELLPQFSHFVYPLNPIISPDEIRQSIASMHITADDEALVYAFAAVTINRTQAYSTLHGSFAGLMANLIRHSLKAYREGEINGYDWEGGGLGHLPVNIKRVMTCIFLGICMIPFGQFDRSFFILREAITIIQTRDVHRWQANDDPESRREVARWQRVYWEAYIHERSLALMPSFPSILTALETGLPMADTSIPAHVDLGFRRLIHLFLVQDETFFAHWRAQHSPGHPAPDMTAGWIEFKQAQLDDNEVGTAEEVALLQAQGLGSLTEFQQADLVITRIWLRTLVWQLALSHGLLCSAPSQSPEESLSFHFPVERLSTELRNLVDHLQSVASVGIHGHGILQKLFDIVTTVADVLTLPLTPGQVEQSTVKRMDDFLRIVKFLLRFEGTATEQRNYVRARVKALQEIYTFVDFGEAMML